MMMLALLLAQTDAFAPARNDIPKFCASHRERTPQQKCVQRQTSELAAFAKMMAAFRDPGQKTAFRCMHSGKVEKHVDWSVAASCMRKANKGRSIGQ